MITSLPALNLQRSCLIAQRNANGCLTFLDQNVLPQAFMSFVSMPKARLFTALLIEVRGGGGG